MSDRYLIVNADDFGLSAGVNRGIVRAHEWGIVTSASLMVRQPAARDAADYARRRPQLSVGLHLDLGEWVYQGSEWRKLYEVVNADDAAAVRAEAERQAKLFFQLLGRPPTHIDSHQHAHRTDPLLSAARDLATRFRVPLRHFSTVRYCGDFYGQTGKGEPFPDAITAAALAKLIASLPLGVTELACHPGDDPALASPYRRERPKEVLALCDPAVRRAIDECNIRLISFSDLGSLI